MKDTTRGRQFSESLKPAAPNPLLAALLACCWVHAPLSAQDFTVNLKETDIQELIKFVAEATGTTIVVDPAVKGKVKVVSSKPVSSERAV